MTQSESSLGTPQNGMSNREAKENVAARRTEHQQEKRRRCRLDACNQKTARWIGSCCHNRRQKQHTNKQQQINTTNNRMTFSQSLQNIFLNIGAVHSGAVRAPPPPPARRRRQKQSQSSKRQRPTDRKPDGGDKQQQQQQQVLVRSNQQER